MRTHAETIQQQFDPQARAYLTSAVHARGPDLDAARDFFSTTSAGSALDVGTGGGHLAFALATHFAEVIAADPSPSMVSVVAEAAAAKALASIRTVQCPVESLPFDDRHFDLVATRYSAHHWLDLPRALREMHRVAKPGGCGLFIDLLGEDEPLVDTHLQAMELLRDPGHVRNRTRADWMRALAEAGFAVESVRVFPLRLEFGAWVERMRVAPDVVEAIRRLQRGAPASVAKALAFEDDGTFSVSTGLFQARAISRWGDPRSAP